MGLQCWSAIFPCWAPNTKSKVGPLPIYGVFGGAEEAVEGYTLPLRKPGVTELHSKPSCGSTTIRELIENSIHRSLDRPAVGFRSLIKTWSVEENGKTFEKLEFENKYQWLTYQQFGCQIRDFMAGLVHVTGVEKHARMLLYAETQLEWMTAAIAALSLGMEVATTYASLGADAALHALNQTQALICVVHPKLVKNLLTIASDSKYLKHIITFVAVDEGTITAFQSAGIQSVHGFHDILTAGSKAGAVGEFSGERFEQFGFESHCPSADDNAVIMYTSGTTGAPKGVQLSHKNLLAACTGFMEKAAAFDITSDNRMLAYLPLAHIMEMISELSVLDLGASMGYGSPHTMINSSVKLKRPESVGDCVILKPTFICFAPAVLDKVYKAVLTQVDKAGGVAKWFFHKALKSGIEGYDQGQIGAGWLYNKAFSKVQNALGGEIKFAVCGSAPLSPDVQKFIQTVFNAPIRQGYGLTECCACATLPDYYENTVKTVGAPLTCTVIRLADWPEGGYLAADIDNPEIGMVRGEILLGGPTVSCGYFISENEPDEAIRKKNEEDFVMVGGVTYFRTGDIGQILPEGSLQVIDRKKDLWKGPQGEYVSLSKVEASLKLSPFVDMALAHGTVGGDYVVGLVMVMPQPIEDLAKKEGIVGTVEELCNHSRIIEVVTKSLHEVCRHGLVAFEIPKKFALLPPGSWTPENGLLTAGFKLKRPQIAKAHQEQLNGMY